MKKKDQEFIDKGFKTITDVPEDMPGGPSPGETSPEGGGADNAVDDKKDPRWEEFDTVRIKDVIEAVMHKREYVLRRRLDLTIGKPLHFDFRNIRQFRT